MKYTSQNFFGKNFWDGKDLMVNEIKNTKE